MSGNRTTELLPCPICGGQPDFQHFNITPNVQGRIVCACGIELRQGKNDTEDDMRIIWNTRSDYAVQAANELTPEQAIAATLGSGTLTAEQVRECVQHVYYDGYNDGSVHRAHGIEETDWQAIADELNARAERTCEYKPMWNDDDLITGEYVGMWYTGCGDALIWNADNDGCCEPPAWCPYCGGKVKEVER